MVGLGDLPGSVFSSWANGVNNLGHVVGISWSTHYGAPMQEAFLWTPENGMVGLGNLAGSGHHYSYASDINDAGWITGWSSDGVGGGAVVWSPDLQITLIGGGDGAAINTQGQVVGGGGPGNPGGSNQAFLWTPGQGLISLGVLPGHDGSWAEDVNDREQVVGLSHTEIENITFEAFIWDRQRGMRSLNSLLDPCVPPSQRTLSQVYAINIHGQIVASDNAGGVFLDPYLPGDLDGDGAVTLQDLATLLAHFGRSGDVGYIQGDIHGCDGDVDLEDLATLLENFGQTLE